MSVPAFESGHWRTTGCKARVRFPVGVIFFSVSLGPEGF